MADDTDLNAVDFNDITDGCPNGDGTFDVLLKSVKAHLQIEYDAQRIRGSEYTQVYLASLQAAMSQSIQWHLGAQIAQNQALLIEQQTLNAEKQGLLLDEQRDLLIAQTANTEEQTLLVREQTQRAIEETSLVVAQKSGVDAQNLNIPKQGIILDKEALNLDEQNGVLVAQQSNIEAQTAVTEQQEVNLAAELPNITKQGAVLDEQATSISKQTEVVTKSLAIDGILDKQVEQATAQVAQITQSTTNLELEALNIPKQGSILDAQEDDISASTAVKAQQAINAEKEGQIADYNLSTQLPAQTAILDQKLITEEAQTKDSTSQGTVAGQIGKRNTLLTKQSEGFDRDAEQKSMRAITDTWGMAIGSGIDGSEFPAEVQTDKLDEVIRHIREGANISGDVT